MVVYFRTQQFLLQQFTNTVAITKNCINIQYEIAHPKFKCNFGDLTLHFLHSHSHYIYNLHTKRQVLFQKSYFIDAVGMNLINVLSVHCKNTSFDFICNIIQAPTGSLVICITLNAVCCTTRPCKLFLPRLGYVLRKTLYDSENTNNKPKIVA